MTDNELIFKLKELVTAERDLVAEILRYLREVEERQLYLAHGYSSMFAFCRGALGYSEMEAHTRIQAMRLMRVIPAVEQKIEKGELSLSVAAKAQSCFRRERISQQEKLVILEQLTGKSTREAERKLAEIFPERMKREIEKPISGELTRIAFTVTKEQLEKFHRLKDLLAHKNFEGRYDLLFEELADMALAKVDSSVLVARKVKKSNPVKAVPKRTRYIPKATKVLIRRKAQNQCQYIDKQTGKRCDSSHALQIDHIQPFAYGGNNDPSNLRLLCGAHNRWRNFSPRENPTILLE